MVRYKLVRTVNHGTWAALLHSLGKSNSPLCYICAAGDTSPSMGIPLQMLENLVENLG